jgi:hypothetical protein
LLEGLGMTPKDAAIKTDAAAARVREHEGW